MTPRSSIDNGVFGLSQPVVRGGKRSKSELLQCRQLRQPRKPAQQRNRAFASVKRDLTFAERVLQADLAEREAGKGGKVRPDDGIHVETGIPKRLARNELSDFSAL